MAQEKKRSRNWRRYALWACVAVFLVSGSLLVRDLLQASKEDQANRQLAQQVHEAREARDSTLQQLKDSGAFAIDLELSKYALSGNLIQYDALWQQNNDLAGWLVIEGTQVDLPVMFTPQDPEHYLRRAFDGSYALSGSLFLGEGWSPDAVHSIIYGHNMNNGTMFGDLDEYRTLEYAQAHPTIRFDTLTEEREYTVIGAFYSRIYEQREEGVFRYYQYTDLSDQAVFEEYLRQVRAVSLYDTGVEVQYGDRLLTLSTCSYHRDHGRFVVVACQKQADQPDEASD